MANEKPEMPHTQTSAPVKPPDRTRDVVTPGSDDERPARRSSDEGSVRGDRMPAGADEPGAGM